MKKNICIAATILIASFTVQAQSDFYSFSNEGKTISDKPHFFNVDSILALKNYKFVEYDYKTVDAKLANYDMEVLGELYSKSFTEKIDHTFIHDIGVLFPHVKAGDMDTIKLIRRQFVYQDSAEAKKVFNHLNKKIISAISVPHYRIIYRENNSIFFISLKEYDRDRKNELPAIINPIYDALVSRNNNLYLLFHYDRRIKTNAPPKK